MKKILICLSVLAVFSCKQDPKPLNDYVTLSGRIENKNSDSLFVYKGRSWSKTIKLNEDGTFKDTFKIAEPGMYSFYDGNESGSFYLKNGLELNMTLDTKEFDETIKYSGTGSEANNYIAEKSLKQEEWISPSMFDLETVEFNNKVVEIEDKMKALLQKNMKNLDSTLIENEQKSIVQFRTGITQAYQQQKAQDAMFASFEGKPSPDFVNYENVKGGTMSLKDLRGKYVYIDVWATWCGPCIREIPSLKEVEKDFHDKNIEFVSLSVDNGRGYKNNSMELAKQGWKDMIKEKELGGIQLLADNAWRSDFVQAYKINGIPRFILIDPAGNVVDANAPRPSSPKLREILNGLENI